MATTSPSRGFELPSGFSRFNFLAFFCDMVSYFGAVALLSPYTILPLYASHLTPDPRIVALIPTLNTLGLSLPQILGARLVARRTRYRPFVIGWAVVERLLVLLSVISMTLLSGSPRMLLLWAPMGFMFLWWFSMGINGPAYSAMLGHAIPAEWRGRLYGLGAAVGGGVGFVFAWIAGYLLEALAFPYGFAACAGMAFVLLVAGVSPLAFVREPAEPSPERREAATVRFGDILRRDAPFRVYLVSQAIYGFQAMPTAIWTSYALRKFRATDADIALITAVLAIAGGVAVLVVGWLADLHGNRAVMLGSTLLAALSALAAWSAPSLPVYIATFVPAAAALVGWQLTNYNILMEFAPPGRVPAYSAVNAMVTGPFKIVAPYLGGVMVAHLGRHGPVFLVSAAAAVAASILLVFVPDPRWKGGGPEEASRSGGMAAG